MFEASNSHSDKEEKFSEKNDPELNYTFLKSWDYGEYISVNFKIPTWPDFKIKILKFDLMSLEKNFTPRKVAPM